MQPLERAIEIAVDAHAEQTDKAGETYILHSIRVMQRQDSEAAMIAAILHDIVEDSDWTLSELQADEVGFPEEAIEAIDLLTKADDDSYEEFVEAASDHHAVVNSVEKPSVSIEGFIYV